MQQPTWVDAMVEEYDSIVKNSAWEIVPRPIDKSVVGSRWIYKVKQVSVLYKNYTMTKMVTFSILAMRRKFKFKISSSTSTSA